MLTKWQKKLTSKQRRHLKSIGVTSRGGAVEAAEYQSCNRFPCWTCVDIGRRLGVKVELVEFDRQWEPAPVPIEMVREIRRIFSCFPKFKNVADLTSGITLAADMLTDAGLFELAGTWTARAESIAKIGTITQENIVIILCGICWQIDKLTATRIRPEKAARSVS